MKLSAESRGCAFVCVLTRMHVKARARSFPLAPGALNNLVVDPEKADRWIDPGSVLQQRFDGRIRGPYTKCS